MPFLETLARRHSVVTAVSQPDAPAGRSLKIQPTPVKAKAAELGIPVFQPQRPAHITRELAALKPDLAVVVAYGRLLKAETLAVPVLGTLNVHFSLLPKYRGAAPVQWSLVHGETRTGVTLFWLDEGMDTGPICLSRSVAIETDDDAQSLFNKLIPLGVLALEDALCDLEAGKTHRAPQTGEPSLAPLIKKEDARLSLQMTAFEIHNLARGMRLWPRA